MTVSTDVPRRTGEVQLSVVIPVYACAGCLDALYQRLTRSVSELTDSYELVLVDDRSLDDGWAVLQRLAGADGHVRALRLSRNFGQHAAITAGLSEARGRWVVVMDCDLQEAPEDIPRLWTAAREGYDVVRTIRRGRHHPRLKRWASHLYRRLTLETDTPPDYSTLSLISRQVVDAFLRLHDQDREYMIALDWLGFDATTIEIAHAERHDGKSAYSLRRLVGVALDGMFFRSTVLLRVVVLVGFVVALIGVVLAGYEIVDYFVEPDRSVPGYTSLAVLLLVLAGFIIVSVGVVGLYVGRIFEQVKDRPLFVIDARAEGPESSPEAESSLEAESSPEPESSPEAESSPETALGDPLSSGVDRARTPSRAPRES
jgi:dolichol-phosphate mannosyltransferase